LRTSFNVPIIATTTIECIDSNVKPSILLSILESFARCIAALACVCASAHACAQLFGTRDASFGINGQSRHNILAGTGNEEAKSLALLPDGKIVIAADCSKSFCLMRLFGDGYRDLSFGVGGRVLESLTGEAITYGMVRQPDGKFVVVGECDVVNGLNKRFCVARFLEDGAFDAAFGGGTGWVEIDFSPSFDSARAVALQPDGKIVVAGDCFLFPTTGSRIDMCVARLMPNGTLDNAFNGTGKLVVPGRGNDTRDQYATAVAIQPDGGILVAGYCEITNALICMIRVNSSGSGIDTDFGNGGWANIGNVDGSAGDARAYSVALQPNGKILLGGECNWRACATRFLANGRLDFEFGTDGQVYLEISGVSQGNVGVARLRGDGAMLLAGWGNPTGGICFAAGALHFSNGEQIATKRLTPEGCSTGWKDIAFQPDGKLVALRTCGGVSDVTDICVTRFHGDEPEYAQCSPDIDGDGKVLATTDALINARVALGMSGTNVLAGIALPASAKRKTWPEIRSYLISQCGMAIP
jgi:uncharacterized delta-60 repeat protein